MLFRRDRRVYGTLGDSAGRNITVQENSSKEAVAVQPVSERPVSPLQERMLGMMAERGFAEATRASYVKGVLGLVERCGGRGPEAITVDEAQTYVAWLKSSGASPAVRSNASAGLRFLYESVLGRTWKPVSSLRQRMSDDLEMRGFAAKTRASYMRSVARLAKYCGKSPETLSEEELRRYFVHLACERKLSRSTVKIALSGIKFLFVTTLRRDFTLTGVAYPKKSKALPAVLSPEEARAILRNVEETRHRACLPFGRGCETPPPPRVTARAIRAPPRHQGRSAHGTTAPEPDSGQPVPKTARLIPLSAV